MVKFKKSKLNRNLITFFFTLILISFAHGLYNFVSDFSYYLDNKFIKINYDFESKLEKYQILVDELIINVFPEQIQQATLITSKEEFIKAVVKAQKIDKEPLLFYLTDDSYKIIASNFPIELSNKSYFSHLNNDKKSSNELVIGNPLYKDLSNLKRIPISRSIFNSKGEYLGAFNADISLARFEKSVISKDSSGYIDSINIIKHDPNIYLDLGYNEIFKKVFFNRDKKIDFYAKLDDTDNYIKLTLKRNLIIQNFSKDIMNKFIPVLLMLGGIITIYYIMLHRIVKPLENFIQKISKLNISDEFNLSDPNLSKNSTKTFEQIDRLIFYNEILLNKIVEYYNKYEHLNHSTKNFARTQSKILKQIDNIARKAFFNVTRSYDNIKNNKKIANYSRREVIKCLEPIVKEISEVERVLNVNFLPFKNQENILSNLDYRHCYNINELLKGYSSFLELTYRKPFVCNINEDLGKGLFAKEPFKASISWAIAFLMHYRNQDQKSEMIFNVSKGKSLGRSTDLYLELIINLNHSDSTPIKHGLIEPDLNFHRDIPIDLLIPEDENMNDDAKLSYNSLNICAKLNGGEVYYYQKDNKIYLCIIYYSLLSI